MDNINQTKETIQSMIDLSLLIKDKSMFQEYTTKLQEYEKYESNTIHFVNGSKITPLNTNNNEATRGNRSNYIYNVSEDNLDDEYTESTSIALQSLTDGMVGILTAEGIRMPYSMEDMENYSMVMVQSYETINFDIKKGETVIYDYLTSDEELIYKSYYRGLFFGMESVTIVYSDKIDKLKVEIDNLKNENIKIQEDIIKEIRKNQKLENKIKKLEGR